MRTLATMLAIAAGAFVLSNSTPETACAGDEWRTCAPAPCYGSCPGDCTCVGASKDYPGTCTPN